MVRLSDLDPTYAQYLRDVPMPAIEGSPWATAGPLKEARVAIISTAGLHRRADTVFGPGAADYRLIPGDVWTTKRPEFPAGRAPLHPRPAR